MNVKQVFNICVIASLVTLVTCCNQDRNNDQQTITIGGVLPMTGAGARNGQEARQAMDIAIEYVNRYLAPQGRKFTYEIQDSGTDPTIAENALQTLIARHKVYSTVSFVSGVVLRLAPVCNEQKVVQMNVLAQSPDIKNAGNYTFSLVNLANVESTQNALYARQQMQAKTAAVLLPDTDYGEGARKVFTAEFQRAGGTVVQETRYPSQGQDYRAQLLEIRRSNPDVVYLPGAAPDMARVLRQALEMNYKPKWLSYTTFENADILSTAASAAEGVVFSSVLIDWQAATGLRATFRDAYQSRFRELPSVTAANTFDAVVLVANAARESSITGDALRMYLLKMGAFEGAGGVIQFAADGTTSKPMVYKTVKAGAFVLATAQPVL